MNFLLDDLNEAQREAVVHGDGPLLVVAGAGSGKTRVLTRRIAWLLHHGVPEWAVLGVTFTNKAAREMAGRVHDLVPGSRIRLSTFHSACASFMRRSGERLGFTPDFTIYDTQDRDQLLKTLMHERDMPVKELRPSLVGHRISALKNQGTRPGDYEPEDFDVVGMHVKRIYEPYQQALATMNAMDFDDLLLHFLHLVESEPELREYYATRYRHVLVDEFQDTNTVQYRIVRALASVHGNLCVVGDPDQSIYSFRGAVVGNILSFPKDYADTKVVKLETNYRSVATILSFAQSVIEHNEERLDKALLAHKPGGSPVEYHVAQDTRDEAREIAYRIQSLLQQGVPPSEIAIFYRARFLSRGLEEVLRSFNLPYELVGDVGFYGRKEVKDLLAYLTVLVNPRDSVAFQRIVNVPTRGIGKVSLDRFAAAAHEHDMTPGDFLFLGMTPDRARQIGISGKAAQGFSALGGLLTLAQDHATTSVEATLDFVIERSGFIEAVCRTGDYQDVDREENVQELLASARRFDGELKKEDGERQHAVATYLQDITLFQEVGDRAVDEPRIQMMTVHAAKGLEFDHVFVVGCEEGVFPHRNSSLPGEVEEERRLFYVAATRARETLVLTRARSRDAFGSGPQQNLPSRFLREAGLGPARGATRQDAVVSDFDESQECEDYEPVYRRDSRSAFDDPSGEAPSTDFRSGERVVHPTYGDGKVLKAYGSGINTKVEVLFASGVRTLLVEYARLRRYGTGAEGV